MKFCYDGELHDATHLSVSPRYSLDCEPTDKWCLACFYTNVGVIPNAQIGNWDTKDEAEKALMHICKENGITPIK